MNASGDEPNPLSVAPGEVETGVDPPRRKPARGDLVRSRLEFQRSLIRAGVARLTLIQVSRDAVIVDGHHAVRAAAEAGQTIDVLVTGLAVPEVRLMNCPIEISEVVAGIVEMGLLRIRSLGWSLQAERCAIEADHIHNLPSLLADFSQERLLYYWGIERTAYIAQTPEDLLTGWEPLWRKLQPDADPAMNAPATAR